MLYFSLCMSYIQISSNFTWCSAQTRKTLVCTERLKRNGSQDNCELSHVGSGCNKTPLPSRQHDSMGEAVKLLLGASKDPHECENWVSASCKMDQQHCHGIQLNIEPKASQSIQCCSAQLPQPACNWYIPKFPAYIHHGGPVSPSGFYLRCWDHT